MAVSQFPVAAASGSGVKAYKGLPGSNVVNIPAGFYFVRGSEVDSYPITVGSIEVESNTEQLVLESAVTNLDFVAGLGEFEQQTEPFSTFVLSIAYLNNLFLAGGNPVGNDASLATSPDGETWTSRTLPNYDSSVFVGAFGDGLYLVTGNSGYIATSPDAITWTQRSASTSVNLKGSTYSGSIFVVVGSDGFIATSPDGISWTSRTSGTNENINEVNFAGSFVAVGGAFNTPGAAFVLESGDGINWFNRGPFDNDQLFDVTFGNGLHLVGGDDGFIATSPNVSTWTTRTLPNVTGNIRGVDFADGFFIVVGDSGGYIATSPDGITWTQRTAPNVESTLYGAAAGDETWMVSGNNGYIATLGLSTSPQYLVLEETETIDLT